MTTPKSLESLEQQRTSIADQIASLGDLRRGSITSTTGRCGKPNCHCHQPKDPGHGPNLRLTYKVEGKTVTESLPDQSATRKAEREIDEFLMQFLQPPEFSDFSFGLSRGGKRNR